MSFWRGKLSVVSIAAAIVMSTGGAVSPARAQVPEPASVRVVHGLRGLVADVYLDGALVLPTFQPERATDPLPVPAGSHEVEIRPAGAGIRTTPLLAQTIDVPAGFVGSLVAHLDTSGDPVLTAFADDTTAVPAGQSRVVVRHTADAGAVQVELGDLPSLGVVEPKGELTQVVAAGAYEVSVTGRGGGALVNPEGVDLAEGTANFMYLIGSNEDGSLGWAAVRVPLESTPPRMIQTGDGSTAPARDGNDRWVLALAAVALAGGAGAFAARMRRPLGEH